MAVDSTETDGWKPGLMLRRSTEHAVRSSAHFMSGVVEAGRAMTPPAAVDPVETVRQKADSLKRSVLYTEPDWETARSTDDYAALAVGDWVEFTKLITETDVEEFAESSGDTNRLHLDDEYAAETRFGGRIVHGTLVSGLISAALARFPGLSVYLSQDMQFTAPAEIGERLTARCEIVEEVGDNQYRITTTVRDEAGQELVTGEAVILLQPP